MYSVDDLTQKFQAEMTPVMSAQQPPAEGTLQNQPNPNAITNSGATNNDVLSYANQFKMQQADKLMPIEADGTKRPSKLR